MRKFYTFGAVFAVVAGLIAIAFILAPVLTDRPVGSTGVTITDEAEISTMALAFVQPPYRDDFGNVRVAGYVDNQSATTFLRTKVSIELRDPAGNRTAVLEHELSTIPAGQRLWYDIDGGTFTGPQEATVAVIEIERAR